MFPYATMIDVKIYGRMRRKLFGYVSANPKMMNEQEVQRYRGLYCGLCRCLGKRHGQLTRLSLTYDMTFLALFLSSMYEPEECEEQFWCMVHPKGKHASIMTPYTEYAADMNVLLAYLNCMDNWQDDKNMVALLESVIFKKGYRETQHKYPRQANVISRELEVLSKLEAERCTNIDEPANCFGRLLGELFVVDESNHFAEDLRQFGFYLGKFIYLYDAVMDYESDKASGNYNPIVLGFDEPLSAQTARELLTYYISACTQIFGRLPIVQDSVIIKNILFSGVWQEFHKKFEQPVNGSKEE